MALELTPPPAPSVELLNERLAILGLDPGDSGQYVPHQIYTLDLDAVLAGRGLDAAYLTGWRYIVRGPDEQNYVVEISIDEAANTHEFNHVNLGSHVDNFIALYDQAGDHDAVQSNDYDIRALRVPACYVLAAWFVGVDHDGDFLVPLAPVHPDFEPERAYQPEEFMDVLRGAARGMQSGVLAPSGPPA